MACNKNLKNCNYKSIYKTYNASAQVVSADLTELTVNGTVVTDTGCSLTPTTTGVEINYKGTYHLSADIVFVATGGGTETIQLYNGTTVLPCTLAQITVDTGDANTFHVETDLYFNPCCNIIPSIFVKASGVTGIVNFASMSAFKLA